MTKAKATKVPITMRALIQRINRKLGADGEVLKTARGRHATELGDYYIVKGNVVSVQHVDPVKLARELGVMAPFEDVAS